MYIVSNVPLRWEKLYADEKVKRFDDIGQIYIDKLKNNLKSELKLSDDINLKNTYFIRTGMNFIDLFKEIIGEISIFFENRFWEECKNTNSLYRVLSNEVLNKAAYEMKIDDYEEII